MMQQFIRQGVISNNKNLNKKDTIIGVRHKPFHVCKTDLEQEPYASIDDICSLNEIVPHVVTSEKQND